MAQQYSIALRNAWLDQWETSLGTSAKVQVRSGAAPANCAAADSGTLLVEFSLAADWASAASSGSKSLSSTPVPGTAVGTNTAAHYRVKDSSGATCHEQGTVTATGGGGDLEISNASIASGQTINITSWSKTAPGA